MVTQLLPAIIPLVTILWIRQADHSTVLPKDRWDPDYDFVVGKLDTHTYRNNFIDYWIHNNILFHFNHFN